MTRPEKTNNRNLEFSRWVREKLPDSHEGLWVTDLDFLFFCSERKTLMLLEVKTNKNSPTHAQRTIFKVLDELLRSGAQMNKKYRYLGCHVLCFEHTFWNNGKAYLDGKEITEEKFIELIRKNFTANPQLLSKTIDRF